MIETEQNFMGLPPIIDAKNQINKVSAFCTIQTQFPTPQRCFTDVLDELDKAVRQVLPSVTGGALNNCHGDWYEWLIALSAWNYHVDHPDSYLLLPLPNVARFDVMRLYQDEFYDLIEDLRAKVLEFTEVELITSNPDFVLLDPKAIEKFDLFSHKIDVITPEIIQQISEAYRLFQAQCRFEEIIGYVSVKTSLRPDRRLQIAHEGSLMKALYIHLQTRQWIVKPGGISYYAASTSMNDPDRKALKTVATHSITTVHSLPQAAVDEVFTVNSMLDAEKMFQQILVVC
ncbi:MAG: hypothetical protein RLZZ511_307 [Cyanobacteriota bacterium]|jgi:hypothetical protein